MSPEFLAGNEVDEISVNLQDVEADEQTICQFRLGTTSGFQSSGYTGVGAAITSPRTADNNSDAFNITSDTSNWGVENSLESSVKFTRYTGNR